MDEQVKYQSNGTYQNLYDESIRNPKGFWARQADLIDWHKPFDKVLDDSKPPFAAWYVGGQTNLCHNAVDRHLDQLGDKPALIYVSTEVNQEKVYTFRELHQEVFVDAPEDIACGRAERLAVEDAEDVFEQVACRVATAGAGQVWTGQSALTAKVMAGQTSSGRVQATPVSQVTIALERGLHGRRAAHQWFSFQRNVLY